MVAVSLKKKKTPRRTEREDPWSEPAGEPRVSRNFEPHRQRRSSVDVDVPEFIPRF